MYKLLGKSIGCVGVLICTSTLSVSQTGYFPPAPTEPARPLENPSEAVAPYSLTKEDAALILQGLQRSVRDPRSLILGEAKAVKRSSGTIEVCGLVNGKNAFGGYTGFQPYNGHLIKGIAGVNSFAVIGIGDGSHKSEAVLQVCRRGGVL